MKIDLNAALGRLNANYPVKLSKEETKEYLAGTLKVDATKLHLPSPVARPDLQQTYLFVEKTERGWFFANLQKTYKTESGLRRALNKLYTKAGW